MASRKHKKTQPTADVTSNTKVQVESIQSTAGNVTLSSWKHCWHWSFMQMLNWSWGRAWPVVRTSFVVNFPLELPYAKGVNDLDKWPPAFVGQLVLVPHAAAALLLLILKLFILSLDANEVILHPLVPVVSLSIRRDISRNHKAARKRSLQAQILKV